MPVIYSSKTSNMLKDLSLDQYYELKWITYTKMYDSNSLQSAFNNTANIEQIKLEAGRQFEKLAEFIG